MQNILITGANGNLGTAVTDHFLGKDFQVIGTVASGAQSSFHRSLSGRPDMRTVNLADEAEAGHFVESIITEYVRIDAAFLLVGGFSAGSVQSTGGEEIRKQISLNFETAYFVVRPLFLHMMKQNAGRIVLVGARPALNAAAGKSLLAYSLSKSLLFKLAELLNEEAKGTNVSVSVVVPGTIDTPLNRKNMPEADPSDWVTPAQLAEVFEFMTSEKAGPLRETVLKVYNKA